jgi:hypothetical protein
MRQLLEFGSMFDWITPLLSFILDVAHGPSHTFEIPRDAGWSGRDVEGLLRQHGVKTWGLMIPAYSSSILITVRQAQARWAEYVLQRYGVPVRGGLPAGTGAGHRKLPSGSDARSPGDWIDRLGDLLWS